MSPALLNIKFVAVSSLTRQVPGAIVECGVWKGGSMMAVAFTLLSLGVTTRDLYLFDTFAGMVPPGPMDRRFDDASAEQLLREADPADSASVWTVSNLAEVRAAMGSTGYPPDRVNLVEGRVEVTVPEKAPPTIGLLRLDTDWYESTRHELIHLFPRLSPGGVLILDDYGFWQGAKRAVDEYFAETGVPILLARIDDTGRIAVVQR